MKILITGSEGSLMQAVIPKLIKQGHTIVGVDNLYRYGKQSSTANINYQFIKQDLTNRSFTEDLCQGFDMVFLAAAKIYGVGGFNHFCGDIIADDTAIQGNILQSCAKHGVKHVVYISSSMVYETCIQDSSHPVTEDLVDDCTLPKTEYGLSKLLGERMCRAFYKQYGINYTIWRPFNIITPHEKSMDQQGFSHVFADFINNILVKKLNPLPIIGDGNQIRCFTWIDDVAEIISQYSFDQRTTNQAFNICNVEPISMKQLAEKIFQLQNITEELKFQTIKDYKNDVLVRIPSVEKLSKLIGDYQYVKIDQSIQRCICYGRS
jgi:nucleoside-diphosphate-sugar epimerase